MRLLFTSFIVLPLSLALVFVLTPTAFGQSSDTTPPVLRAFSFSPSSVNTATGPATVQSSFSVTDDLSGVDAVAVTWYNPSQTVWYGNTVTFGGQLSVSGTVSVNIPQFSQGGTWTPTVELVDKAGNVRNMSSSAVAALGFLTALTVLGGSPSISGLNPGSSTASGPMFTIAVNGSGFVAGSIVQWNGSALPTTYVSGTQLTASVSANLIAGQRTASVTVLNPGGILSNAVTFTISAAAPAISTLSPSSATANGPAFTMTINGSGFLVGSTVQWNGSALSTTYFSGAQLTAAVPANLIAIQGKASVRVLNPGGTTSSAVTFTITAPTPNISGLSSSSVTAGGPAFTLTVSGSGFLIGSTVQWNGSALSTSYLSGNQLTASISGTLIAAQGTATIMVANPAGAMSNSVSFTINAPVPISSTLSPTSATAGGPQFTLTVNGSGFLLGSAVQWNGSGTLIAAQGTATIMVANPAGAMSNSVSFTINAPVH